MLDSLIEHAVLDAPLSKVPMFAGTPFANGSRLVFVERFHRRSDKQDLFFDQCDLLSFVHHDRDRIGLGFDEPMDDRAMLEQNKSITIEVQRRVRTRRAARLRLDVVHW